MPQPGYPVFDADNHLYEPKGAFHKYLPQKYQRSIEYVGVRGGTRMAMKGRITEYMPNPTFERVARPGAHADYYRGTNTEGLSLREMTGEPIESIPAFREPGPRLELLDELGVHRALMFPTIANLIEYTLDGDPDLVHATIHALNCWLHEIWSFAYSERIFTTPVITLPIVEEAVKEVEWVLERGARVVLIRPAPVTGLRGSRSVGLPEFDPVWARLEEAGTTVCMHASFAPLNHYYEQWEPGRSDSAFKPSPLKEMLLQHREIEDALAALVCHGVFDRFPRLKVLSVENGADWVGHLQRMLDQTYRRMPQEFASHPVETLKRNVYVSPFWENDVAQLVRLMGVDHVLFGSDYPHPEGLAEPLDYIDYLDAMPELDDEVKQKIMSSNGNALLELAV
jgi:predicted TIM-barrel fold metal-dependent hydrolase